jgi:hypothetical protein
MKAIEFLTILHSPGTIEIPISYQDQLQSSQEVRVIVLISDNTPGNESWKQLATRQFFEGYSDEDAIYDTIQ